jgi:hypothetical protein
MLELHRCQLPEDCGDEVGYTLTTEGCRIKIEKFLPDDVGAAPVPTTWGLWRWSGVYLDHRRLSDKNWKVPPWWCWSFTGANYLRTVEMKWGIRWPQEAVGSGLVAAYTAGPLLKKGEKDVHWYKYRDRTRVNINKKSSEANYSIQCAYSKFSEKF